jgi:RNA polymerase sigma factor (sigma-70 family)
LTKVIIKDIIGFKVINMTDYKELDISKLIELSQGRDDLAFSELVIRYTPLMRKVAGGFGHPLVGDDEAMAEACIGLHKAVMSFNPDRQGITFGLYARICIYRRLSDLYSSKETKRMDRESGIDVDKLGASASAMSVLLFKERVQNFISVAREVLSDYEYQIFLLYIQGYDTVSMCEALSKDRKSVENAKARMLKRLRSEGDRFLDL